MTEIEHKYQRCKPMTSKNIGRNLLKSGANPGVIPHQGEREKARRLKRMQRQAEKVKL